VEVEGKFITSLRHSPFARSSSVNYFAFHPQLSVTLMFCLYSCNWKTCSCVCVCVCSRNSVALHSVCRGDPCGALIQNNTSFALHPSQWTYILLWFITHTSTPQHQVTMHFMQLLSVLIYLPSKWASVHILLPHIHTVRWNIKRKTTFGILTKPVICVPTLFWLHFESKAISPT